MKLIIILYMILYIPGVNISFQDNVAKDTSGWEKIGIATIYFKNSSDEIYVLESGKYSSVKFAVTSSPINIIDLEIFYETGDKQDIKVNLALNAPGESQAIELNGGERRLTKICFDYKPASEKNGKKSVVELWGLKARTTP